MREIQRLTVLADIHLLQVDQVTDSVRDRDELIVRGIELAQLMAAEQDLREQATQSGMVTSSLSEALNLRSSWQQNKT